MKYFSLFSGIGGFELGILSAYRKKNGRSQEDTETNDEAGERLVSKASKRVGSENGWFSQQSDSNPNSRAICVGFSEIDKYAISIYKKHFPTHKEYGNVTNIKCSDVPDFDLLCGGFPCQSFSIAGKRRGFNDTRGTLFFEIARIAQEKQPRLLLLENVKGLLSHDKGRTFGTILRTMDELGYDLQWQVLNSKNFSVPQNRERVFIIGHLRGTSRPQVFPIRESSNGFTKLQIPKRPSKGDFRNTTSITQPSRGDNKGNRNIRRLTPVECERLQGFPDGWTEGISDTQRYKCLGNAVTVNVIEAIMEKFEEI